jgi:hypothetical protein
MCNYTLCNKHSHFLTYATETTAGAINTKNILETPEMNVIKKDGGNNDDMLCEKPRNQDPIWDATKRTVVECTTDRTERTRHGSR